MTEKRVEMTRSEGFKESRIQKSEGFKESRIQKSEGFKESRIQGFKWFAWHFFQNIKAKGLRISQPDKPNKPEKPEKLFYVWRSKNGT